MAAAAVAPVAARIFVNSLNSVLQALKPLIAKVRAGAQPPALVIGMPVALVGVAESKRYLAGRGLA